jgi:hypothetical protein
MRHKFEYLVAFCYCIFSALAFYGDPADQNIFIPKTSGSAAVTVGNTVYIIGGQVALDDSNIINMLNITTLQFSSNNTLQVNTFLPQNPFKNCMPCNGYDLGDNDTIVITNVQYYPSFIFTTRNMTVFPSSLGYYHISNNSFTYGPDTSSVQTSMVRTGYTSAISTDKTAIYILGGENDVSASSRILRYNLKNTTSPVTDLQVAVSPSLGIFVLSPCAVMLPYVLITHLY